MAGVFQADAVLCVQRIMGRTKDREGGAGSGVCPVREGPGVSEQLPHSFSLIHWTARVPPNT